MVMTLTTIEHKLLFIRAINSLPPDIKRFEIWPRIIGQCTPIAPSAPHKPTVSSKNHSISYTNLNFVTI